MKNRKKIMRLLLIVVLCLAVPGSLFGREAKADGSDLHSGSGWRITVDGKLIVDIASGDFPTKVTGGGCRNGMTMRMKYVRRKFVWVLLQVWVICFLT